MLQFELSPFQSKTMWEDVSGRCIVAVTDYFFLSFLFLFFCLCGWDNNRPVFVAGTITGPSLWLGQQQAHLCGWDNYRPVFVAGTITGASLWLAQQQALLCGWDSNRPVSILGTRRADGFTLSGVSHLARSALTRRHSRKLQSQKRR